MTIDNKRRLLLRGTLGVGALAGAGLLAPRGVLAAWSKEAFFTVETSAANVESISVFISNNPSPLAANFVLGAGASGYAATRVKMGKTSDVVAVVKSGGTLQSATKEVKVTIGGCGG
jgi:sulfur-oxidizing protein SoxY